MIKIGIIGAGMIAEAHIKSFQAGNRVQVTWLADINQEAAQKLADKFKIEHITTDYNDILKDPEVQSVVICTPPKLHKPMFIAAVEAGKHVLVEKPAAMTLSEMDEMIAVAQKHPQIKVSDCSARHSRLQPKFVKIKELIDSGALGEIYYIHHNACWRQARPGIEYHPTAKWFLNKEIAGGGPLFDWGVYDLSFHLGILSDKPMLDQVESVMLKSGLDSFDPGEHIYNVEEMFVTNLKMSGDTKYYWERGNHSNVEIPNETRIYGTKGGLRFGYLSWDSNEIAFFDYDENDKARESKIVVDMENHSDELALAEHWADVIEGKAEPALSLETARKHLDIIYKCYAKAEQ